MIVPFVMAGAGMALVFAPSAAAVLSAVRADQAGQASGATNAIRETGGVLGVAVLASIFTHAGGYGSPQAFVDGLVPALWVGVAMLGAGALAVLVAAVLHDAAPRRRRSRRPRVRPSCGARTARHAAGAARGGRLSASIRGAIAWGSAHRLRRHRVRLPARACPPRSAARS